MDFLSFLLRVRGIGPGVRHLLAVASPRADVLASGGACSVHRVQSECMGVGVDWGFCIFLRIVFLGGGGSGSLPE